MMPRSSATACTLVVVLRSLCKVALGRGSQAEKLRGNRRSCGDDDRPFMTAPLEPKEPVITRSLLCQYSELFRDRLTARITFRCSVWVHFTCIASESAVTLMASFTCLVLEILLWV